MLALERSGESWRDAIEWVKVAPGSGGRMLQVEDKFTELLGAHTPEALDAEAATVLGLWPDGRIALFNSAWQTFALANGGADILRRWPLGASMHSGISGVLQDYYALAFARVLERQQPWVQTYDCHSEALTRQFRLQVLPLGRLGLLLIHTLVVEVAMSEENPAPQSLAQYLWPHGIVRQCSNCRRTRRSSSPSVWDWVPQFVSKPPESISHGICSTCLHQFYGEL